MKNNKNQPNEKETQISIIQNYEANQKVPLSADYQTRGTINTPYTNKLKSKKNETVLDPINTSLNSMKTAILSDATMAIKDIVNINHDDLDMYQLAHLNFI